MGKLVRDNIPAIIAATGGTAVVVKLDGDAYAAALLDKLAEESAELRDAVQPADVIEEAADVLEVLISIVELHGRSLGDLLQVAADKRAERGGFHDRLWLTTDKGHL